MEADTETWGALAWGTAAAGVWGLRSSPSLRAGGCREPALGFSAGGVGGGLTPLLPQAKKMTWDKGVYAARTRLAGSHPVAFPGWEREAPQGAPSQQNPLYSALPGRGVLVFGDRGDGEGGQRARKRGTSRAGDAGGGYPGGECPGRGA